MSKWPYNTARWQQLRRAKLEADPLCAYCPPGRLKVAQAVDHRLAINLGGDPWSWDNLVSTCNSCHSAKTSAIEVHGQERVKVKGVDPATGMPLDPHHWWRR